MAIVLDYEVKHHETYGYYKDYSKYLNKKSKNVNKTSKLENISQSNNDLNEPVNSKIDKPQNLNSIPSQKICYNDIHYQKKFYGNSISLGIVY